MKVFDHTHAKGNYFNHLKRAAKISGLFIGGGFLGLVHAICPWFLTNFLTLFTKRINFILSIPLCACNADDETRV